MPTKPYKNATVLLQFGDIFPTPERHTSFRTDNMMHVLEVIIHISLRMETNV
jgi:hypothetical protein